ncbi:hypothetical protein AAMO2058_000245500 [Amorphochlora amoebiformis]
MGGGGIAGVQPVRPLRNKAGISGRAYAPAPYRNELVVLNSFDRKISTNFAIYERDEIKVTATLKDIIIGLQTYTGSEFKVLVRFIAGMDKDT